jgi:hypothetical protein
MNFKLTNQIANGKILSAGSVIDNKVNPRENIKVDLSEL